jgi:AraC family transcriptional regulator
MEGRLRSIARRCRELIAALQRALRIGGKDMREFQFKLNPLPKDISTCCTVLHGAARRYSVESYRTTLSVKAVVRGAALYRTRQGRHLVTDDSFLILNEGQEYALDFQWPGVTETLCPFFQPGFLEHVSQSLRTPIARQLDDIDCAPRGVGFHEHLYPRSGRLGRLLSHIHDAVRAGIANGSWLEDCFYELGEAVVELNRKVSRSVESVTAVRSSTREELYRRLYRGRDYLSSCYDSPVTVASAARAARLSPAHFPPGVRGAPAPTSVCGRSLEY